MAEEENRRLLEEIARLKSIINSEKPTLQRADPPKSEWKLLGDVTVQGYAPEETMAIIVVGASGDLAKKKTFPSIFNLYGLGLIPKSVVVFGYARKEMSDDEFRKHLSQNFNEFLDQKDSFLQKCHYISGPYDDAAGFQKLHQALEKKEGKRANRVFYMAIPPSVFVPTGKSIKAGAMSTTGWNRVIVEKPFGKDLESSNALARALTSTFKEEQIYRIDHYLGKEMVQNLMVLRFANTSTEPIWNHHYIKSVIITFKEDIGTGGRGGYFDSFGIIRDILQNHLLQVFSLVAMEPPVSLSAEDVRDEKVRVLNCCPPIINEEMITGQYTAGLTEKGYTEDPQVPDDSVTPTYAACVIWVNNARWRGVPFILKAGKALNERKAEIRIQFKQNPAPLFPNAPNNELVIRVQPKESVYMKVNAKEPGLSSQILQTELDLTYNKRFEGRVPDAYERLIWDATRGDHNLFVRTDELEAAWKIFTPVLHAIEGGKLPKPTKYPFGSRGPQEADQLINRLGYNRNPTYKWTNHGTLHVADSKDSLSTQVADYVTNLANDSIKLHGSFTIAFSGGSLPKMFAAALGNPEWQARNDFSKWHVFYADERHVALDNADSNHKATKEAFLDKVKIPSSQVHPINPSLSLSDCAADYEKVIKSVVTSTTNDFPSFDLILLGMGPDGHTASLFPDHPLLKEESKVIATITDSPKPPPQRITFTLPTINAAKNVVFIAAGAEKATNIRVVHQRKPDEKKLPSGLINPSSRSLHWFIDKPAAAELK